MSFDYESQDAIALAALVRDGEVTPEQLLDCALGRAAKRNPELNAIPIPMEDEARRTIAEGIPDGPLAGVPYLLKDLAVQYSGVRTTNGCRFFADAVADHDSELTTRYKRAGLVIFGKSASPEFGLTTTTESALFGQTRNPWNRAHTTGGSSGGAAAAVAAGILPAAHASDGGGSIRIPAACCGLFGLKPTRGRVPFGPDAGEGWSGMSTMHAVTRSVRDSALLLDVSEGPDVGDPYWAPPKARPYLDEVGEDPGTLRIGRLRKTFNGKPTHADCEQAVDDAAALCESLGHRVEPAEIDVDIEALGAASQSIMGGNLLMVLEQQAETLGRPFGPDDIEGFTYILSEIARKRTASDYALSVRTIHAVGRAMEQFMADYDVLLSPTMGAPPQELGLCSLSNPDIGAMSDAVLTSVGYTQIFNATGQPGMSVPLAWNAAGLPIGIQFVGHFGREDTLLRLAGQLEAAKPWAGRLPVAIG